VDVNGRCRNTGNPAARRGHTGIDLFEDEPGLFVALLDEALAERLVDQEQVALDQQPLALPPAVHDAADVHGVLERGFHGERVSGRIQAVEVAPFVELDVQHDRLGVAESVAGEVGGEAEGGAIEFLLDDDGQRGCHEAVRADVRLQRQDFVDPCQDPRRLERGQCRAATLDSLPDQGVARRVVAPRIRTEHQVLLQPVDQAGRVIQAVRIDPPLGLKEDLAERLMEDPALQHGGARRDPHAQDPSQVDVPCGRAITAGDLVDAEAYVEDGSERGLVPAPAAELFRDHHLPGPREERLAQVTLLVRRQEVHGCLLRERAYDQQ